MNFRARLFSSGAFLTIACPAFACIYYMSHRNPEIQALADPRIVIKKGDRRLELFDGEKLIKTYRGVLGFTPSGNKETEGDGRTPEGEFYVFVKNDKSKYHLSLGVSYPAAEDAMRGLTDGLITAPEYDEIMNAVSEKRMPPQYTKLGGEIYIHGGGVEKDWTWGCMALKDEEMKELFDAVSVGSTITILP